MTEYLIENKYKGTRSKPRLKDKQEKKARTSKIYAEQRRYPRLDPEIQFIRERDTKTGWDTRHLPASCYGPGVSLYLLHEDTGHP